MIELEKQKKQLLFSYGTLQLERVQLETYGRKLAGKTDTLQGYQIQDLKITDTEVIKKSGKNTHPIAVKTNHENDTIEGVIFEITHEELIQTDLYEVDDYQRVLETFESGEKAWIYTKK